MFPQKMHQTSQGNILKLLLKLCRRRRLLHFVQIVLLTLHLSGFAYGIYGKRSFISSASNVTEKVMKIVELLKDISLMLTNIVGAWCLSKNPQLIGTLCSLQHKLTCSFKRCIFISTMIIMYILILIIVVIYFAYIEVLFGWSAVVYVLPGVIEYCLFNFTLFAMLYFIQEIKEHFVGVNNLLKKKIYSYFESNSLRISAESQGKRHIMDVSTCLDNLRYITRHQEKVCDLLDTLNEEVTPLAVLIIISTTVNVLWNITMIMDCAVGSYAVGLQVTILLSLLILVAFAQGALGAWVGEQIEKEGEQTIKICFSLINKLSTSPSKIYDERIDKQLGILLNQSKSRKVKLQAGGFFQVNWGIMGMIISTVGTYSIVIIQFYVTSK